MTFQPLFTLEFKAAVFALIANRNPGHFVMLLPPKDRMRGKYFQDYMFTATLGYFTCMFAK